MSEESNNVKVMVRVRLFNKREIAISEKNKELLRSCVRMRNKTCAILEFGPDFSEREREAADFDECFWSIPPEQQGFSGPIADQKYVYDRSGLKAYHACLEGYNVCMFAYGQTGSGKTYSMLGSNEDPGVSPRLVDDIFANTAGPCIKMTVECMFFEIYNEKVRDLFNKKSKIGDYDAPKIRQHPKKGVFVDGLIRKEVSTAAQTKNLLEKGTKERAMAETKMNATSSRSHAVFQIQVTQKDAMKGTQRISTVNLVDLAGSEKIKLSGASGDTLTEAKNINQSLSTLRRVIDTLIENSQIKNPKHHKLPPFRESVLTYVLSDSLGGNSKTQMIATVSPHECNIEDTIGTLRYALKAKAIVCDAKVNEEKSAAMMESMRDEIMLLQQKLREGGGSGGVSEEIQKEIEEREREMEKMEEEHKEMETMLEQAKEREAEIEAKFKEADDAKQTLHVTVATQKKERFAAAFRNAFLISAEKKKIETSKLEFQALQKEKHRIEEQNGYLTEELTSVQQEYDQYKLSTEQKIDGMTGEIQQRDVLIAQLKRQLGNANEENVFLKEKNTSLQNTVTSLQGTKAELEKRVQRQHEELLATSAAVEREQGEKAKMQQNYESKLETAAEDLENMRKRKDKYKIQWMEAKAKLEGTNHIIERLDSDRASFLTALKAQQQVLEEQGATVSRIVADKKLCDERNKELEKQIAEKDQDSRVMGEALREYQSAATEWAYENHTMSREVERLQNAALQGAAFGDASPMRSAYSGSASPSRPPKHVDPSHLPPRQSSVSSPGRRF